MRDRVKLYVAGGIAEPVIAHKLGICANTLTKHFSDELLFGRDVKRAENLERLDKAAHSGNVAAMKHLDAKFATVAAAASFEVTEAPRPRLGKKEQAAEAATTAGKGTDWGNDLGIPRTTVN